MYQLLGIIIQYENEIIITKTEKTNGITLVNQRREDQHSQFCFFTNTSLPLDKKMFYRTLN